MVYATNESFIYHINTHDYKGVEMNYSSRQQPSKHWFRKVDWILVLVITVLAIISVTLISSAMGGGQYSANFSIRQIIYYILGAIMAFLIMIVSPKKIKHNTYLLYFIFVFYS